MKHLKVILSMMFVFALVLSACGSAGEDTTPVPTLEGTDVLPGTGATAAATTAPTLAPTATTAVEPTAVITEEVETPIVTGTATMTETIGFDPHRVSNWLGADAQSADGEDLGEIGDLVLNVENETADYVVVEAGGFLGIGEKEVVIPWNMVEISDTTGMEDAIVTINVTKDQMDAAPDVDFNSLDLRNNLDWDEEINTFWTSGGQIMTGTETMTDTAPAATPEMAPTLQATGALTGSVDLQGSILATTLLGYDVENANGDDYGDVEDAIIDPQTGDIQAVLVSADESLDLDDDVWFAVPLSAFRLAGDEGDYLVLEVEPDVLTGAPTFTMDTLPDFSVSDWDAEFTSYWNSQIQ